MLKSAIKYPLDLSDSRSLIRIL